MAIDARGFSVKFYMQESNYDLMGNNIPVLFIQDAMKFPDLILALKSRTRPWNAAGSQCTGYLLGFYFLNARINAHDYVEMSNQAIVKNLRMMDVFGVHTFELINEQENHIL